MVFIWTRHVVVATIFVLEKPRKCSLPAAFLEYAMGYAGNAVVEPDSILAFQPQYYVLDDHEY